MGLAHLCIVVSLIGVTATRLFYALQRWWARPAQQPSVGQDLCNNQGMLGIPKDLAWYSVPAFRFAVVNLSATRKYVQVACVQASLLTRTNQLHVNPRGSISGFLQSRFTNNEQKNEQMQAGVWSTACSTSQQVTKVRTHAHMQSLACPRTHGTNTCLTTHHFHLLGIQSRASPVGDDNSHSVKARIFLILSPPTRESP